MREDIDPKKDNAVDETMLEDILKHLDGELEKGAVRMSVVMDEKWYPINAATVTAGQPPRRWDFWTCTRTGMRENRTDRGEQYLGLLRFCR